MRPDGTHRRWLVGLGRKGGDGPFYSPDGDEFLFVRRKDSFSGKTLRADGDGSNVREPPCRRFFARFDPETYSPDGRWVLGSALRAIDPRDTYPYTLARVKLASCRWKRVVSPTWPAADWQPLPDAGGED
jgi:hypothetical protein